MSRQIKSVSLNTRQMQIAERMPNFSKFVQEALDSYAADIGQGVHTQSPEHRTHGKCNPMSKHLCKICWPLGRPNREDWIYFRQNPDYELNASSHGMYEQLVEQSLSYNIPEKKSSDAPVNNRPKSKFAWFRRFWS
jgi:hypothetical protein